MCHKRAVRAETSPASCYVLKMAHRLKNGEIHSGKEFRSVMEPPQITKFEFTSTSIKAYA